MSNYQHIIESFTFITGTKGVFDLRVNGDLIFSKHALGRHANEGEALQQFRSYVGEDVPTYP